MNNCVCCIKDGVTGECYDIKDKVARELITSLNKVVEGLTGGSTDFITTEEFNTLKTTVTGLSNTLDSLDNTYAKDSDITNLQSQITTLSNTLDSLDLTYAKDSDITNLQSQITTLSNTLDSLRADFTNESVYCNTNIQSLNTSVNTLNENKANKDLSNVTYPTITAGSTTTGSGDRVIEHYISSDGLTWYRKWASGWKECGVFVNAGTWGGTEIQLPVTFQNTNFNVSLGLLTNQDTAFNAMTLGIYDKTVSSVSMYVNQNFQKHIYCCGY